MRNDGAGTDAKTHVCENSSRCRPRV